MSDNNTNSIRNPKYLSVKDIGRPMTSGACLIKNCAVKPPLPCMVILVHGVNDVGEAYQDQDQALCRGLNTRLGRNDLAPHSWRTQEFMIEDPQGGFSKKTCSVQEQTCINRVNRSPVIPFYWGYKPVDHATWQQDQRRYRDELLKNMPDVDLPYDTYREFDQRKIRAHNGENIDNLRNWLDTMAAKNGGTFANATTNIPDMFGPGTRGLILAAIAKLISRSELWNHGDWSHPIYQNPHRIYQAYAARRLADLILDIRKNEKTKTDTINIVAHSQGTILTMLANMWVHAEGFAPADCVILNHSPYSLENRWLENTMPGNQQSSQGRQKTFANFCKLMAKNPRCQPAAASHDSDYIKYLTGIGCLSRKASWDQPAYNRNNFGMVYNYFCPNDQVVSIAPVQGFGWRGIPDKLRAPLGDNLRQRVFCRGVTVGDKTGFHFEMPSCQEDDSKDTKYRYRDVTINAPLLPEPFVFSLQGEGKGYKAALSGNDPRIAKAAMKSEKLVGEFIGVPHHPEFYHLLPNQNLSDSQLQVLAEEHPWEIVKGTVIGYRDSPKELLIYRRMTEPELDMAIKNDISYSQHSSIVKSSEAIEKSMVYDLAIGKCNSFEFEDFWDQLLLKADWRREENPLSEVREYYKEGILPPTFKPFMNKPEKEKGMPIGEHGVVNDYGARQVQVIRSQRDDSGAEEYRDVLQWENPKPINNP